jgi:hypothetical protein
MSLKKSARAGCQAVKDRKEKNQKKTGESLSIAGLSLADHDNIRTLPWNQVLSPGSGGGAECAVFDAYSL